MAAIVVPMIATMVASIHVLVSAFNLCIHSEHLDANFADVRLGCGLFHPGLDSSEPAIKGAQLELSLLSKPAEPFFNTVNARLIHHGLLDKFLLSWFRLLHGTDASGREMMRGDHCDASVTRLSD